MVKSLASSHNLLPGVMPVFALAACFALTACSSIRTESYPEGTDADVSDITGFTYFLPMRQAKFSITRTVIKNKELKRNLADAKAGLASATAALVKIKANFSAAQSLLLAVRADTDAEAKTHIKKSYKENEKLLKGGLAKVTTMKAAVKNAEAALNAGTKCSVASDKISLKLQPMGPDLNRKYRAIISSAPMSDKDISITANEKGLLSSTDAISHDRTADIIVEFAKTIAFFGQGGFTLPATPKALEIIPTPPAPKCPKIAPIEYAEFLDLSNEDEVKALNDKLSQLKTNYKIEVAGPTQKKAFNYENDKFKAALSKSGRERLSPGIDGLLYRVNVPHKVIIKKVEAGKTSVVDASIIFMPNAGPLSVVPLDTGLFVKTTNNLKFKDGVLVSRKFKEPSIVMEVVRLPLRIVDGVFESVSRIIPFTQKQTQDQTALINSQIELLKAQQALKDLEKELGRADAVNAPEAPTDVP